MDIVRISQGFAGIRTTGEFRRAIGGSLRDQFDHEFAAYGICELVSSNASTRFRLLRLINVDFPPEYLARIISPNQIVNSPVLSRWIQTRSPQLIESKDVSACQDAIWRSAALSHNIRNVALHGLVEVSAKTVVFFAFGNVRHPNATDWSDHLSLMVPHLYSALSRVLTETYLTDILMQPLDASAVQTSPTNRFELTDREFEIVLLLQAGKSNAEISDILGISSNTARNHVQNILRKTSTTNRFQAAVKALEASRQGGRHLDTSERTAVQDFM